MTAFLQKYATLLMVILALPALLIVLGMTGAWQPAVAFTKALGLSPRQAVSGGIAQMPDWTLQDMNGATVRSADYQGKVVLVNFWATWCPPCIAEIPDFIKVQEEYRARGLTILGISLDEGDPAAVRGFMKARGLNYPVLRGDSTVTAAFGDIKGIPASFLIDKTGRVVLHRAGMLDAATLRKALEPIL
ncbi:MAG: TlpA disulfide reductase family protein [Verrucomicrobiota bacterium]